MDQVTGSLCWRPRNQGSQAVLECQTWEGTFPGLLTLCAAVYRLGLMGMGSLAGKRQSLRTKQRGECIIFMSGW